MLTAERRDKILRELAQLATGMIDPRGDRRRMIEERACFLAERDEFAEDSLEYWRRAEDDISSIYV